MALPSSPVFRDSALDGGSDTSGYLALGLPDPKSLDMFESGGDGTSQSTSGTNLKSNQFTVATLPSTNAPSTFQIPPIPDSSTGNSADPAAQETYGLSSPVKAFD